MRMLHFLRRGLLRWWLAGVVVSIAIGLYVHSFIAGTIHAAEFSDAPAQESNEPIQPIQAAPGLDQRKVVLGQKLFNDTLLSHNHQIACATCHVLEKGGADGRARSLGIYGAVGDINAPTVLDSGFNFSQFWDGRAPTLEKQVEFPLLSKTEMGSSWAEVIQKLNSSAEYTRAFRQIYGGAVRRDLVENCIAEFERSLTTPNSRFDRYLRHDRTALTARELEGYQLFKSIGCASCHQGVGVGGNMYQKMGVIVPYFTDAAKVSRVDRGRFNVTEDPRDLYFFKVPSLRNVALTAPYFHDGSAATLATAVQLMAKYQLSRTLSDEQVESIVAFLETLTGELNGKPL